MSPITLSRIALVVAPIPLMFVAYRGRDWSCIHTRMAAPCEWILLSHCDSSKRGLPDFDAARFYLKMLDEGNRLNAPGHMRISAAQRSLRGSCAFVASYRRVATAARMLAPVMALDASLARRSQHSKVEFLRAISCRHLRTS
jgi:hypothetical protein